VEVKLFCKTLLPASPKLRKIGGELSYDSWVFGANHEYPDECCYGWGRIEVTPTVQQKDDIFLHVLYPTFAGTQSMPVAVRVDGTNVVGAKVAGRVAMFSKTEQTLDGGDFQIGGTGWHKFLLFDLVPGGLFEVLRDGNVVITGRASKETVLAFDMEMDGEHDIRFRRVPSIADARR